MSLYDIAKEFGTDKSSHGYCPHYEQILFKYIDRECTLVELGIAQGKSLLMWKQWLPKANIIGFDSDNGACNTAKELGFESVFGHQQNHDDLRNLVEGRMFDIIIDDAGHNMNEQLVAFRFLFDYVIPGGWYAIEDLEVTNQNDNDSVPLEVTRPISTVAIIQGESKIRELHLFGDSRGDGILFLRKR